MSANNRKRRAEKPPKLFVSYCIQLLTRLVLFAGAVFLFVTDPHALDVSQRFGLQGGFNFVDLAFLLLAWDFLTKFFERAHISAGSLKQYRIYHIPTAATLKSDRFALRAYFAEVTEEGKALLAQGRLAVTETYEELLRQGGNARNFVRRLLNDLDFLRIFSFKESDLTVDRSLRAVLYRDRAREVVPVVVFWVVFNALVAMVMLHFGVLNEETALLWSLFYFLSDMICVVFWCPLQLVLMRNRCCTTCQIFNWDAIMVATPLLFVGGWFGWLLVALAVVVLVRWELAALRHPERFDERTNARLSCAQCTDKLCYLRGPLRDADAERVSLVKLREKDAEEHSPAK